MEYFTYFELEYSKTAMRHDIKNQPTVEHERNLEALVANVLDPLRKAYGGPITVSSGFRNTAVNTYAEGGQNSQHKRGEAADIFIPGNTSANFQLAKLICQLGKFDQLILENVASEADYSRPQWIHVSWKRNGINRKQILIKVQNGSWYEKKSL